jgi:hypothetical protein
MGVDEVMDTGACLEPNALVKLVPTVPLAFLLIGAGAGAGLDTCVRGCTCLEELTLSSGTDSVVVIFGAGRDPGF